jgi:hypothetical protein
MMWAQTTKVGCGYVKYGNDEHLFVCNYSPMGNMKDEAIYQRGAACSKCPEDKTKCDDGLCTA